MDNEFSSHLSELGVEAIKQFEGTKENNLVLVLQVLMCPPIFGDVDNEKVRLYLCEGLGKGALTRYT